METPLESFPSTPAQDAHMQAAKHGPLQGVTILDIDGAHRPAVGSHGDNRSREDAIHVEQQGAQAAEIVIDSTHS